MSSQNAYPGQQLPIVNPPPQGSTGSSIYNQSTALQNQSVAKQTAINNTGGSYRRKRRKRGKSKKRTRGGAVVVAVPPTSYPEQGAGDQTIAGITTNATKVGVTSTANQQYDQCVGQGASCTSTAKVGGKNVNWKCMSGGTRKRRRRRRRTKRRRTKRRRTKRRRTRRNKK